MLRSRDGGVPRTPGDVHARRGGEGAGAFLTYHVLFTAAAKKSLKKLDRHTAALILGWIRKNLEGCENPRLHGKGLTANRSGEWRYRVGDYRLIADIQDRDVVILMLHIGHRREIYS
ncbi:MAG: type II toxin-antitoxin system RelE/ParE family toxin [Selenomonas sp.]|nr:type II toxin-antitoxin system RelE/ParE family toxin [Selenomonas sp.]MBQ1620915.1 type II toxin-antitoxin system RelE/ParE family toxin [Selenomonas sp.]